MKTSSDSNTLDALIVRGESLIEQIKREPSSGMGLTISTVYNVLNKQIYYDWKSDCLTYIRQNCDADHVREFELLSRLPISPENHEEMISILKDLKSVSSFSNDLELDSELNELERLSEAYEKECNSSPISDYCIRAFYKWYAAALSLFKRKIPAHNPYLIEFCNIDKSQNGYSLREQYNLNLTNYRMLIDHIKHGCELETGRIEKKYGDKVFIVHGHNDAIKSEVAKTLKGLGLHPIILHEQPNKGKTIIEKLEKNSSDVGFAVILLTADDEGKSRAGDRLALRARQNVIFEMGLFMGILGRERTMLLLGDGVEEPSDIKGVVYTSIDSKNDWKDTLCDELKSAGYDVSKDKL